MKRILSVAFVFCCLGFSAVAQDTWFCSEVGTTLCYIKKDAKGSAEGVSYNYIIRDKQVADGRTTIIFDVVVPGQNSTSGCSVWTADGQFHNDASAAIGQFGDGITATGNSPVLPESPLLRANLADCSIKIDALMLTSEYSKISFTANEDITVPAGKFRCWCLEYDITDTVMGLKAKNHVKQWMAKGIGDVKVVTTDKSGRVVSEKELVKISK